MSAVTAFTLGNPTVYDENLAAGMTKAVGGAVFLSLEAAEAAMVEGHLGGRYMPESWFPESAPVPAAIYGLALDSEKMVTPWTDDVGAHRLLVATPIVGRVKVWRQPWDRHLRAFVRYCRRQGDYVDVSRDGDGLARVVVTTTEVCR